MGPRIITTYTLTLTHSRHTHSLTPLESLVSCAFRLRAKWKPTKAWEENRPQHYGDQTSSFAKICPSGLVQDFSSCSHAYIALRFSGSFTKTSRLPHWRVLFQTKLKSGHHLTHHKPGIEFLALSSLSFLRSHTNSYHTNVINVMANVIIQPNSFFWLMKRGKSAKVTAVMGFQQKYLDPCVRGCGSYSNFQM